MRHPIGVLFLALARNQTLKTLASRFGMRGTTSFVRRFVAGETVDEAIAAVRGIETRGMMHTLDLLGESVTTVDEAAAATRAYLGVVDRVVQAGIGRNLSIKLTQLGLDLDRAVCLDNLRRLLDAAATQGFFVRIDMEGSAYTQATLELFETVWGAGYRDVGPVVQSYLYRSADDVRRLNELGARVRLVKGAYQEPKSVAFQRKADVDRAFVELMQALLEHGTYPAIATHDPAMIEATCRLAEQQGMPKTSFEFQMLYGVRRDLQTRLAAAGYPFRVYVPFGREWYPYLMRRLGERPANIGFVLRSLWREV